MNAYETEHAARMRALGADCAVLLKTDGSFPLDKPGRLALFGSGARRTVKGGTGSGEVNSRYLVTAEQGLEAAGFSITSKAWLDGYDCMIRQKRKAFIRGIKRAALKRFKLAVIENMGTCMPEPDYALPLQGEGEAAIYVLSRIAGEGTDRSPIPGDLLLTETETRDILQLNREYERFLLVLNTVGPVDLSPVREVGSILLLSQLGAETGSVLADLVLGKRTPSGKLASTWYAWEDRPQCGDFGEQDDTRYREGVYVGYRYFDSVGKEPMFPFGFGLSYTGFALSFIGAREAAGVVTVEALVKNTGRFPGREVVQLYASLPQGRLDQPYQTLAAFAKTGTLQPGAEERLSLSFDLRKLASYDTERASWILEPGDTVLRLGNSSRDTVPVAVLRLDGEATVRRVKSCLGEPDFADWRPERINAAIPEGLPVLMLRAVDFRTEAVDYERPAEVDPLMETLTDDELSALNIGAFGKGIGSVIGNAARAVAGAAGETVGFPEKGIPSLVMADGPAGLRLSRRYTRDKTGVHSLEIGLPESMMELMPAPAAAFLRFLSRHKKVKGEILEQNCTAIPIGTALAQSWDPSLAEQCGDVVGDEMERFGVQLWLAPALNLHRDVRCGRNFEYFSEDPLLSGRFAAAITRGVQRHPGRGVTVKHLVANNQETNRYNSNSQVSERALRELYLRGFGIAVREGRPHALMTSYNLVNGVHTAERRDLIEDVLRAEFGFRGLVMSDWIFAGLQRGKKKYPSPNAARIAAAGNDLTMPGCKGDRKAIKKGLRDGTVTRRQLQINATRIVRLAKQLTNAP